MSVSEYKGEIMAGVVLIMLLLAVLNPFDFLMLDTAYMMFLGLFVVVLFAFLVLVWRSRATDERELAHQHAAAKISYTLGVNVLAIGIVVQTLSHTLDPWLAFALGVMVLGKIGATIYYKHKH